MKHEPSVRLTYNEPLPAGIKNPEPLRFEDVIGKIRRTTSVPDWVPRGRIEEQFAIYYSGANLNLCVYDYEFARWEYLKLSGLPF
jgi:hypothetical protein